MSPLLTLEMLFHAEWGILVSEKTAVARHSCTPPKVPGDEIKEALGIFPSEQDSPPTEKHHDASDDAHQPKYDALRYHQNKPEKGTEP